MQHAYNPAFQAKGPFKSKPLHHVPHTTTIFRTEPLGLDNMEEDLRLTSLAVWRFSLAYLNGAIALDDADPNPWVACNVTHQCYCQSIELGLKAFLLAKGWSAAKIQDLGHSMAESMNAAMEAGFPALPDAKSSILMQHQYNANEYRYVVTRMDDSLTTDALAEISEEILNGVAPHVAVAMGDAHRGEILREELRTNVLRTRSNSVAHR